MKACVGMLMAWLSSVRTYADLVAADACSGQI